MSRNIYPFISEQLQQLQEHGLYKSERIIAGPQQARVAVNQQNLLNLCANNYLGLANHPQLITAAKQALDDYGFGMASVRFICGTNTLHQQLEIKLAEFLQMEACILFSSCFDANGGIFEALLDDQDAIISANLNHASIIDGIRLSKAQRRRYQYDDMAALEQQLQQCQQARHRLIVTDGVFSMDGSIANLPAICDLADQYDALVMIDDCHATGFLGANGRGTHEFHNVIDRVDIISSTLGKALGGASGGFICARKELVAWLRQKARPYLFSNALAPMIAASSLTALELVQEQPELRTTLKTNSEYFRTGLSKLGFELLPGEHPIIPIMLGDAKLATTMAEQLLAHGIYVVGFSYPVVPMNQARIRTQMSSALSIDQLDQAINAFETVGKQLGVIN